MPGTYNCKLDSLMGGMRVVSQQKASLLVHHAEPNLCMHAMHKVQRLCLRTMTCHHALPAARAPMTTLSARTFCQSVNAALFLLHL